MLVICGLLIFIKCSLCLFCFLESMNLNIKLDVPHCLQYSVFFLITGTKWSGVAKTHPLLGYSIAVNSSKNVIVQPIDMMLVRWCYFVVHFIPLALWASANFNSSLHVGCCCVLLQLDRILQFLLRLFVLLVAMC
jgi:hypothetical protein